MVESVSIEETRTNSAIYGEAVQSCSCSKRPDTSLLHRPRTTSHDRVNRVGTAGPLHSTLKDCGAACTQCASKSKCNHARYLALTINITHHRSHHLRYLRREGSSPGCRMGSMGVTSPPWNPIEHLLFPPTASSSSLRPLPLPLVPILSLHFAHVASCTQLYWQLHHISTALCSSI